jgi:hypothetical protein
MQFSIPQVPGVRANAATVHRIKCACRCSSVPHDQWSKSGQRRCRICSNVYVALLVCAHVDADQQQMCIQLIVM